MYKNPAKGVRLPKNKPTNYIKALSKEEQQSFFDCCSGTFYNNLFIVAINTGLRPGELFALTEQDIDFTKNEIVISKTLLYQKLEGDTQKTFHIESPKTQSSYRTVPINKFCGDALHEQIRLHRVILHKSPYKNNLAFPDIESPKTQSSYRTVPINKFCGDALHEQIRLHRVILHKSPYKNNLAFPDLLFTTKYGTPLNSVLYSAAIHSIIAEINLTRDSLEEIEKFSGHTFRHTFATRCFEAGIQPKTFQTYLGHSSLSMTMDLYTSVMQQKKSDDIKLLENTIGLDALSGSFTTPKIINFL